MKKNLYWGIALLLTVCIVIAAFFGNFFNQDTDKDNAEPGYTESTPDETMDLTESTLPFEPGESDATTVTEPAEEDFVPSVTYKAGPNMVKAIMNGQDVARCVVVTTVEQAVEKSTDIVQEERDLLLEVYEALSNGSMNLPVEGDHVIRDLVDVSFLYEGCRKREDHSNKEQELEKETVVLSVTLDFHVEANTDFVIMAYHDGVWSEAPTVNNGDGTVDCELQESGPVAFVIFK